MVLEIQVMAWERYNNVVRLNRKLGYQPCSLKNFISDDNTDINRHSKYMTRLTCNSSLISIVLGVVSDGQFYGQVFRSFPLYPLFCLLQSKPLFERTKVTNPAPTINRNSQALLNFSLVKEATQYDSIILLLTPPCLIL